MYLENRLKALIIFKKGRRHQLNFVFDGAPVSFLGEDSFAKGAIT